MKTITRYSLATLTSLAVMTGSQLAAKRIVEAPTTEEKVKADPKVSDDEDRVQIALLLDTSGSMNGLIAQAKTQLWKVVNTFIDAERDGKVPYVEVALYEYGNSDNALGNDWIRLVSPLTRDLDKLSKDLFALDTNGGEEYCGAVIQRALGDLAWDERKETYKVMFIAGNEPFTQGRVNASEACKEAFSKGIIVNAIHCGDREEGINGGWNDGAALAGGDFLVINQDKAVAHIKAPQDEEISQLGMELNKTYLGYGKKRKEAAQNQAIADQDARRNAKVGASVQRAVTKASSNYCNVTWDLVDAVKEKKVNISELEEADLPADMKGLSLKEQEAHVAKMAGKRAEIQKKIKELNEARVAYVAIERQKSATSNEQTLDEALIVITRKQASGRGYSFRK